MLPIGSDKGRECAIPKVEQTSYVHGHSDGGNDWTGMRRTDGHGADGPLMGAGLRKGVRRARFSWGISLQETDETDHQPTIHRIYRLSGDGGSSTDSRLICVSEQEGGRIPLRQKRRD